MEPIQVALYHQIFRTLEPPELRSRHDRIAARPCLRDPLLGAGEHLDRDRRARPEPRDAGRAERAERPQTPARQSAWSSTRTEFWFEVSPVGCSLVEPIKFCTWCPTSCAITYACAKSPGARRRFSMTP